MDRKRKAQQVGIRENSAGCASTKIVPLVLVAMLQWATVLVVCPSLIFTGLAGRINRNIFSNGVQFDASWAINDSNVLRGWFLFTVETARVETNNQVFPVDAARNQTSDVPFTIISNQTKTGAYYGFYLQDDGFEAGQ
jgi:hypothetical protein